jgi:Right handed beta helix region
MTIKYFLFFVFCLVQNILFAKHSVLNFKEFLVVSNSASDAFQKAANKINLLKENVTLIIPKGTYIVGKQKFKNNGFIYEPENIFVLSNCKNIKIMADKGAFIRYSDGLRFGSFEKDGSVPLKKLISKDRSTLGEIGAFIQLINCTNVVLENVNVNGNNLKMILGNEFGDLGYQCNHWGLLISNSNSVKLQNCSFNYFGLDGIYILNDTSVNNNFEALNCKFEYNGRQGFSWAGGNGVRFKNCSFSFTGKGAFGSSPAAGVDIEPNSNTICKNAIFDNCKFINNMGISFVNDGSTCKDIAVNNSYFLGMYSWLLYTKSPKFSFTNCTFVGAVNGGCNANNWDESTTFKVCTFKDTIILDKISFGSYNIEMGGTKRMLFENCNFYGYNKRICYLSNDGVNSVDEKSKLKSCNFYLYNNSFPQNDYFMLIRSFMVEDCNFIDKRRLPINKTNYLLVERNTSVGINKLISTDKSKFLFWTGNYTYDNFSPENAIK